MNVNDDDVINGLYDETSAAGYDDFDLDFNDGVGQDYSGSDFEDGLRTVFKQEAMDYVKPVAKKRCRSSKGSSINNVKYF